MTDLVKRLREQARIRAVELDFDGEGVDVVAARLDFTVAADEIVWLRARLAEAEALLREVLYWYWNANSTGMSVDLLDRIDALLAGDKPADQPSLADELAAKGFPQKPAGSR